MLYEHVARPVLFGVDPEKAHTTSKRLLRATLPILPSLRVDDKRLSQHVLGRTFQNPIGIAAGFDKDGEWIEIADRFGFGFTEIGTVTPKPQLGNPPPRIYRFPKQEALQNAMGFNSLGHAAVHARLSNYPFAIPIGVNIGKNKTTKNDDAISDYLSGVSKFSENADYLVANLSSPNTPHLQDLQNEQFIKRFFEAATTITKKPILLKISPDMDIEPAIRLSLTAVLSGAAGIIATNTTTDYSLLRGTSPKPIAGVIQGGISGRPLRDKSFKILEALAGCLLHSTPIISVGGIDSGYEAFRRILAGATLVQIYTGIVYHGFGLARRVNQELLQLMEKNGFDKISDAVGHNTIQ